MIDHKNNKGHSCKYYPEPIPIDCAMSFVLRFMLNYPISKAAACSHLNLQIITILLSVYTLSPT